MSAPLKFVLPGKNKPDISFEIGRPIRRVPSRSVFQVIFDRIEELDKRQVLPVTFSDLGGAKKFVWAARYQGFDTRRRGRVVYVSTDESEQ